jgi:hypothetical protein
MATVLGHDSIKVGGKQHASVGSHALQTYKEGSTQEFRAGAPVSLSSGLLVEITDPVADAEAIVGIATKAATARAGDDEDTVTEAPIPVAPAIPGIVFEAVFGNVADDLYALAQADVGKFCALRRDDTNDTWYLGANDAHATNPPAGGGCRVVALKDAVGTVNGKVYFVFLSQRANAADSGFVPGTIYA